MLSVGTTDIVLTFLQIQGVTDSGLKPHKMKSVAVIGGGLMGSGIATALALNNVPVILKEVNQEFLQAGLKRIEGIAYF